MPARFVEQAQIPHGDARLAQPPARAYPSLIGDFGSLLGRFNSLFARLGNSPFGWRVFKDLARRCGP
jgi:hypothetical protein